jgi:predicted hydrocarbon binding protein
MSRPSIQDRFKLAYHEASYRRVIAGKEVILHCHHYNSRLQNTIEGAARIDGKRIISGAAEAVFRTQIIDSFRPSDDEATKWSVAEGLYAQLGYGKLDCSKVDRGTATAASSHFVEGWNAGFAGRNQPVCTFTEGYLQGAIHAVTGKTVYVRERSCMITGAPQCTFEVVNDRHDPIRTYSKKTLSFKPREAAGFQQSPTVDAKKIVEALVTMPIIGNDDGLIPAFGVYLANTPADFYNLVCIEFVEAMSVQDLLPTARKLLVYDAETCAMNTFRGIMSSPEWDGLVAPMVREQQDNLFGVIAISNGLGWGNWHVREHTIAKSLSMESLNGYEALGYSEIRGRAPSAQCFMLTGVIAGIMELVYGTGTVQERFGTYKSNESECIACGAPSCVFHAERG